MHILFNMFVLWMFGSPLESVWGPRRFLIYYLLCGVGAGVLNAAVTPGSMIPTVGASGAIAAVLGAYLVLYPRSKVLTIVPLGFFIRMTLVPASIVLGLWFVLQFFSGVLSIGGPDVGGVAFWAHIGGFITGVVLAKLFGKKRREEFAVRW